MHAGRPGGGDGGDDDSVYAASEHSRRASLSSDERSSTSSSSSDDRGYDSPPTSRSVRKPWRYCDPSASERERSSGGGRRLLPAYAQSLSHKATTLQSNPSTDGIYETPPPPRRRPSGRPLAGATFLLVVCSLTSLAASAALTAWQRSRGDEGVHARSDAEVALEAAKNRLAQALSLENFVVSGNALPNLYSLGCISAASHTNCTPTPRKEAADHAIDRHHTNVGFRAPRDGTYFISAQVTGRTLQRQPSCLQLEIAKVSAKNRGWPEVLSKARTTSQDGESNRAGHFSVYTALAASLSVGDKLSLRVSCVQDASCRVHVNGTASYLGLVHIPAPA